MENNYIDNNLSNTYSCLVGIDPGGTLGLTLFWFNPITMEIIRIEPITYYGEKLNLNDLQIENHGVRYAKCMAFKKALINVFHLYKVIGVASESPFYNRLRPGAFGPLNEILFSIRQAVAEYDSWLQLDLVPPSNVKQALGAKGNCGKPEMIEALLSNKNITDKLSRHYSQLNEHEIDSIAVAYWKYTQLLNTTWKHNT